jgi:CHASE2 domain-containing sensor protein
VRGGARYNRLRGALFPLVGVGTTVLVLLVWAFGVFDEFERNLIDARFSIRGPRQPPAQMQTLVYIDEVEVRGRTTRLKLWALPTPEPLA